MEETELVDIWRAQHPNDKIFTFHTPPPNPVFTRLDFFLLSFGLVNLCVKSEIVPVYLSDHSYVKINMKLCDNERGKGFWKLNCNLLHDAEYVQCIKEVISNTVNQNKNSGPQLLWDTLKMQIRGKSIQYSSRKKKSNINLLKALEKRLGNMQTRYNLTMDQQIKDEIVLIKQDIDNIMHEKTKGAIMRCKVRWHEEGETSSKYFLSLEKRQYNRKNISRLKIDNGDIITDNKDILKQQQLYYQQLYTSRNIDYYDENISNIETQFLSETVTSPHLNNDESNNIDHLHLSEQEIWNVLKTTKKNKTPGNDGLPAEFYITFWHDIKIYLMRAINGALESGQLSITQRQGVITLLPKKDKDTLFLKNWRPISLLNQDYKLITKALATRIKTHLTSIISTDQSGFIKGRYIGENIVNILLLMDYCDQYKCDGLFVALDFEKAFDYLEWSFVERAMKFFNFGPNIIEWVKIIYRNISSCILNNGWYSEFFKLGRGMRQGCPLSPYLFIIAVEILSINIRNSPDIEGINIGETEYKVSQYADDTALTLKYSKNGLIRTFETLKMFEKISGLKINQQKTQVLPFGTAVNNIPIELPLTHLQWTTEPVNYLGVKITPDKTKLLDINYKPILGKIKSSITLWRQRSLTLFGKVTVIKSLLASKLTYLLSILPNPPTQILKECTKLFFQFLWNEKPDKIKRSIIYNKKEEGGLNLFHLESQNQALKIGWVKRLLGLEC